VDRAPERAPAGGEMPAPAEARAEAAAHGAAEQRAEILVHDPERPPREVLVAAAVAAREGLDRSDPAAEDGLHDRVGDPRPQGVHDRAAGEVLLAVAVRVQARTA